MTFELSGKPDGSGFLYACLPGGVRVDVLLPGHMRYCGGSSMFPKFDPAKYHLFINGKHRASCNTQAEIVARAREIVRKTGMDGNG